MGTIGAKPVAPLIAVERWGAGMSYKIVATKEDQTMKSVRQSQLLGFGLSGLTWDHFHVGRHSAN